jgi:predicted DNA binding CopG/RHH family protein
MRRGSTEQAVKKKAVTVMLTESLKNKVKRTASAEERTISGLVSIAARKYLEDGRSWSIRQDAQPVGAKKRVALVLSESLLGMLKSTAEEQGRTLSGLVSIALWQYFEEDKG